MSEELFSVYQWGQIPGGEEVQERVRHLVPMEEAIKAFRHYTDNVAAKMGWTNRVIVTDGGDCLVMEWIQGKGIIPPEGVEIVSLEDPEEMHNKIATALGESVAKKPHES